MKHIKTINEYQRTVGFRYSEPKEGFNIKVYLDGELTEEEVELTLGEIDVAFGDIYFDDVPDDYIPEEECDTLTSLSFDINVYNEKEIERIMEDFSKTIYFDYNVKALEVFIKPIRN